MTNKSDTCQLVCGQPYGNYELALVVKQTYTITASGDCVPADDQVPLIGNPGTYDDFDLPQVSPPDWDSDLFAFKPGVDVVVQGQAYAYGKRMTVVDTAVQIGNSSRTVRVHGDRHIEWHNNQARFSTEKPFDRMPVRYDRAYGGYDKNIDMNAGEIFAEMHASSMPEERWDSANRQYYPRNPAGCGYLARLSKETTESVRVPNLEFPFDPVTPERLAIGAAENWISAPLPAAYDWIHQSWFPRIAYLGLTPEYHAPHEGVQEMIQGWITPELLRSKSIIRLGFHPNFQHGASPCLVQKEFSLDDQITLHNLSPDHPERQIKLANISPRVHIHLTDSQQLEAHSHLGAIVIRPDQNQLIEVWSARTTVCRHFSQNELDNMKWKTEWN